MRNRAWFWTITVALVVAGSGPIAGQASKENTLGDQSSYLWNYNGQSYGFFELGGLSFSDSVRTQRWLGIRLGSGLVDQRLALEISFHFVRVVQLRARGGHHRLASTPLAQAGALIASQLLLKPIDSSLAGFGTFLAFAMGGTDLAFHISDAAQLYGGVVPDLVLFSDQDGVMFQSRMGLRIMPRRRMTLSFEAVHNSFWGFDDKSRDLDWGFGVYLSGPCGPTGCFD